MTEDDGVVWLGRFIAGAALLLTLGVIALGAFSIWLFL